ncbi:hypothetical protein B9Z65_1553 [Elsinoe australis]|uniref:D-isomer specific 2-hydroxyacid dehydrogenase NAD-binding domain-containing protein n=1 Tax=Elsinoe australis TaxID=40998 RepID=A0A2P7YG80_9PEZI|nr:hypothetical protein B9Z65_1553 [Elsinoe australis]
MSRPKALLIGEIELAQPSWDALSSLAELVTYTAHDRTAFISDCRSGLYDGVVAICDRAPSSQAVTGKWDEELLSALPSSLRFICHMGAGYDSIDVHAFTRRGIHVSNVPRVVEDATADTAIFLILAALRGFNNGILAIRNGTWKGKVPPPPLGLMPQGKTLGILGMGGIGQNLKRKAEVFGMYVGFDELLTRSDVLSLNLPLNDKTRNIISTKEFEKMKHDVVIVNTARGGVLDEEALVKALDSDRVRAPGVGRQSACLLIAAYGYIYSRG